MGTFIESDADLPLVALCRRPPAPTPVEVGLAAGAACLAKAERAGFDTGAARAAVLELLGGAVLTVVLKVGLTHCTGLRSVGHVLMPVVRPGELVHVQNHPAVDL